MLVEPTERGLALMPQIAPVFGEVAGQLFEGFSDDEAATFISFLQRMRENLGPGSRLKPQGGIESRVIALERYAAEVLAARGLAAAALALSDPTAG